MFDRLTIDNTRFIYTTNFSGDPKRDAFGDARRKVNLIIPDEAKAKELLKAGFKIKNTKPRKDDPDPENFVPEYYVMVQTKYRKRDGSPVKYPPNVYLVANPGTAPVPLTEETIDVLDKIRIKNVNVVLNPRQDENGEEYSLYVRTMYVEQDMDDDPFAAKYRRQNEMAPEEDY